jgi:hypothetical protein
VRQISDAAGLPSAITFRSFRHGDFTAAGDADLSDADTSAVGGKTEEILDIYPKPNFNSFAVVSLASRAQAFDFA